MYRVGQTSKTVVGYSSLDWVIGTVGVDLFVFLLRELYILFVMLLSKNYCFCEKI